MCMEGSVHYERGKKDCNYQFMLGSLSAASVLVKWKLQSSFRWSWFTTVLESQQPAFIVHYKETS